MNNNLADEQLDIIWNKAKITDRNPNIWRKDVADAWICKDCYGATDSVTGYGWEADHCEPVSKGGKTELANLRPLHWANNRSKSDNFPLWSSEVTSDGEYNVQRIQHWRES